MTCIVGYVDNGSVFIGGDSAGSNGYGIRTYVHPKVFLNGEFIMGYTSSFRMGQLLEHSLDVPKYIPDLHDSIYKFMCTTFIDNVRQCLIDGGYATVTSNEEQGGVFLIGFKGHLFRIESDYQVAECSEAYDAVGSGQFYALGALYASTKEYIEDRIKEALECAEYFTPGVRGPFNILELKEEQ
jgi:ATP-dependent protease HslVU (ClpYQ) peptidase subunit